MKNSENFDVLIVGAGPAGSAAAIRTAARGLKVGLVERVPFPRDTPGEALHPDIDRLFEQLGVMDTIAGGGFVRFPGWFLEQKNEQHYIPFGDTNGVSKAKPEGESSALRFGYQAWRAQFDSMLVEHARQSGVEVIHGANTRRVLQSDGRVVGVETEAQRLSAGQLIDATGYRSWLSRQLGLQVHRLTPKLVARYGYSRKDFGLGIMPKFREHASGWTWLARINTDCCQCVQLSLTPGAAIPPLPASYGFPQRLRGADVSWRIVHDCAGPGYLICGDAAAMLDPAAAGGVARAIRGGIEAADVAVANLANENDHSGSASAYPEWVEQRFAAEVVRLVSRYAGFEDPPLWVDTIHQQYEARSLPQHP